eukprot:TRINITY_DN3561_c0_g2_i2.p1 TRINITY_DN3561_c0_g2~~TRINITY_DN3561_c0_g2_i2.p1  ORF type:complete len:274 (-),score=23.25 TRINITY_DN3561_c0_g2_i2:3-824(-)
MCENSTTQSFFGVPEGTYCACGWADFQSYANVRANKTHNSLFNVNGSIFAVFKKLEEDKRLWTQDKEQRKQIPLKEILLDRPKLRDLPFFYKKRRKDHRFYRWHLFQWDERQEWQHVLELQQQGDPGKLIQRRLPPSVVHVQESNKMDERLRLLVTYGEGILQYVEQLDWEEQQQQKKVHEMSRLQLQDLCHQTHANVTLSNEVNTCLVSDPFCPLLARPPLRGVRPFYLESATLDNDTGVVQCLVWAMDHDTQQQNTYIDKSKQTQKKINLH